MFKSITSAAMLVATTCILSNAATAATAPKLEATTATLLDAALTGDQRSDAEKARDVYRHPKDALAFYGLTASMSVIEIFPGGGWWTNVLAPVLRDKGKLSVAMNSDINNAGARGSLGKTLERYAAKPKVFDKVEIINFDPAHNTKMASDGSADMVLLFRDMHNLIADNKATPALKLAFDVLKKGGVLAIEQHRWPDGKAYPAKRPNWEDGNWGYVQTSEVVALAKAAGFVLAGSSEVNANAKDTKDYPNSVWSLPPTLADGDTDKAKYLAIGESDRMTLKFVKP